MHRYLKMLKCYQETSNAGLHVRCLYLALSSGPKALEDRGPGQAPLLSCHTQHRLVPSVLQSAEGSKGSYLVPQGCGHLVDHSAQLPVFSRVPDVGPGAQGDKGQSHYHVAEASYDVQTDEPGHARDDVRDEDDNKQCGRGASRVEDILAIVVLDILDVELVYLALQLLQVAPAKLLPAHLLHPSEQLHRFFLKLQVFGLQVVGCQEWFVPSANLYQIERCRVRDAG